MIVTNDAALAEAVRQLRSWGRMVGAGNFRLSAIEAAVHRVMLPYLEDWAKQRQTVASWYDELLGSSSLACPTVMPYAGHAFNVYAARSRQRDHLASALRDQGMASAVHYPQPVHLQERFGELGYVAGAFPVSEAVASDELSLPIYPELSEVSVQLVAKSVQDALPHPRAGRES